VPYGLTFVCDVPFITFGFLEVKQETLRKFLLSGVAGLPTTSYWLDFWAASWVLVCFFAVWLGVGGFGFTGMLVFLAVDL